MDAKEIDLIKQAQEGSVQAFDKLVRLHDRQILQMIHSIVGNLHDAYDVYQETFIRAFNKISTFRFESELSTWLGRIAINLSINWRKRQRRKQLFSLDPENESYVRDELNVNSSPNTGAEGKMLRGELAQQIEEGIQKLANQQRVVFVLKHIHGHKIKDIAEMMDCAEGTVKNHLFRATQKLKIILQPYYKNEV